MTDLPAVKNGKGKEVSQSECTKCTDGWQIPHFLGEDALGNIEDYGHTCVFCNGKGYLTPEEDLILLRYYKSQGML